MSLKRYAIIAAANYHNSHNNSTTTTTVTTITAHEVEAAEYETNAAIDLKPNISNQSGTTLTTYYSGGLGLFHQQNFRTGTGLLNGVGMHSNGGGNAHTNVNVVNGNVNLLLGGAMLSLVTTILCVVCYCCHRNIKKRTEAAYRQQRQWLDNDPNMEIYSVEQCYETSGLFLGDSTDGLSTLPALHYEPPPSYDAVVLHEHQLLQQQQQQQQQQQLLTQHELQRISPPPGYRSSLDVSNLVTVYSTADAVSGLSETSDISTDLSASTSTHTSSSDNVSEYAGAIANLGKQVATRCTNMEHNVASMLNMKKVLNAQSCCSLQRAEVEHMWNTAAAAVADRIDGSTCGVTSNTELMTLTPHTKRIYGGGRRVSELSRRYLHDHSYRSGCPLCGKFRYDPTEDATFSASIEGGLDAVNSVVTMANATAITTTTPETAIATITATTAELQPNFTTVAVMYSEGTEMAAKRQLTFNENTANGNNNSQEHVAERATAETVEQCLCTNNANINDEVSTKGNNNNNVGNNNSLDRSEKDQNANSNMEQEQQHVTCSTCSTNNNCTNLNAINDNGIISLDMSKIIDKTGLPTYEGALKLESSGYV